MEIGFVNFNQEALNRAGKVLRMLQGQGAIDELGLGRIRDVFSNTMFPGLSVLQTRAKYFVMLPALYAYLERKSISDAREARLTIRKYEERLTYRLMDGSDEKEGGIIGAESLRNREKYVKYDPTYVYQSGMETYGLLKTAGNLYGMLAERSAVRSTQPAKMRGGETEDSDDLDGLTQLFVTCGEDYDFESTRELDIALSHREASFLKDRIVNAVSGSLISELLDTGYYTTVKDYDYEALDGRLAGYVSEYNYRVYSLSLRYSRFAHLLRLFYALLYDRGVGAIEASEQKAADFHDYLKIHGQDFSPEKIEEILEFASPKLTEESSVRFCREAARMIAGGNYPALERLTVLREQAIKGPQRSKLLNPNDYEPGKPFDIPAMMTYRWSTIVRTVFNDIATGLKRNE